MHNIPIVFEDDWLMVVNKPAGLLTVPTPKNESRTLTSILKLYPCHRLDRQTSGLIIYAKNKEIEAKMADSFRARGVLKTYIAFVHGRMAKNFPIEGKTALTKYKVLKEKSNYSIVEVSPETGRTNQIRIHFKNIGHPLVGEDKFAFRKDFVLGFKRVCLEASELTFKHPVSGENINIKIDLSKDLADFLASHD